MDLPPEQPFSPPPDRNTPPTVQGPLDAPLDAGPPAVRVWFFVYASLMALLYVGVLLLGVTIMLVDPSHLDMDPMEATISGSVYAVLGGVLVVPFGLAPFLPRRRWVWVYDLVLICLGMTSCCTLPACIPLLIYWIKPQTRQWYGW